MADEMNGEFSDNRTVEITENEDSSKISSLTQKISDLERENGKIVRENEDYRQRIEELKASVEESRTENVKCKQQLDEAESEKKTLGAVAARAAELEAEVSRLQHDLVSAMSDLQETSAELSELKRDMEGVKQREKEKDVKLEAVGKERDLLLAKIEKLEEADRSSRGEAEGKEKEIRSLKKTIEELEVVVESSKVLQKLKNDLENTIEILKGQIKNLESSLVEKEKIISGFEMKERAPVECVNGVFNGDALVDGEKKGSIGGLKQKDWVVVGGSTVAAVAVMGAVCYMHAAKKH